jgi:uncharacterized phage protein (TIGR02218 family)
MLQAPASLVGYLAQPNPNIIVADLLTIAFLGGLTLRYTNSSSSVTRPASDVPGSPLNGSGGPYTWSVGPPFDRVKIPPRKIGLDGEETEIRLYPSQGDLIGSFTWQEYAFAGQFDGATVEVDRYHWTADGTATPLGAFITIYGAVTDLAIGRSTIAITAKTLPYLLDQPMPKRLYQAGCAWPFGGTRCGYDRVNGKNALGASTGIGAHNITAGGGSNQAAIVTGFTPSPPTAYDQGTITGTSGANNGIARTVTQISGGAVRTNRNFPYPVTTGDGFQLLPGCDHTLSTCINTFNNGAANGGRYGGMPYIPPPELAL